MHGDFSNITFSPDRSYSTVFDLQGRVGLDANRNEQTAILLHYLRTAMADLVGPYAGPATSLGFEISDIGTGGFSIGAGRYYVDGILVENPAKVTYAEQPHAYIDLDDADRLPSGSYVVYLKVWERHVTEVEDPSLHEPALGLHQPDSASRAQVVWQVRALPLKSRQNPVHRIAAEHAPDRGTGVLDVRTSRDDSSADDPCTASPDASYTGENQLYRVEIRRGGTAADGATFAWSRDNGSVIHPVRPLGGTKMRLTSPARDRHTALEPGHWVEVVDDAISLRRDLGLPAGAPPLHRIDDIDPDTLTVILATTPDPPVSPDRHPYLRRWDHTPSTPTRAARSRSRKAPGSPWNTASKSTSSPPRHGSRPTSTAAATTGPSPPAGLSARPSGRIRVGVGRMGCGITWRRWRWWRGAR
ncbi:hypothetical protein SAV14893_091540 [Streptomyces avermitilis]|uniref:Uncharacterized protein n=1 Tax=Streptomyces avermitilis TaxID=33903 RepID=A0A4D4MCV1_STRAX|nr:DUF6519 domain-containing protein [Streptomyces avermitilis]GDY69761.1 hypothetical protein SAV14893_091540 [Streptomyces avermitilis]